MIGLQPLGKERFSNKTNTFVLASTSLLLGQPVAFNRKSLVQVVSNDNKIVANASLIPPEPTPKWSLGEFLQETATGRWVIATRGTLPTPIPTPMGKIIGGAMAYIFDPKNPTSEPTLWAALKMSWSGQTKFLVGSLTLGKNGWRWDAGLGQAVYPEIDLIKLFDPLKRVTARLGKTGLTGKLSVIQENIRKYISPANLWFFINERIGINAVGGKVDPQITNNGTGFTAAPIGGILWRIPYSKAFINWLGKKLTGQGVAGMAAGSAAVATGVAAPAGFITILRSSVPAFFGQLALNNEGVYIGPAFNARVDIRQNGQLTFSGPGGVSSFNMSEFPAGISSLIKDGSYQLAEMTGQNWIGSEGRKIGDSLLVAPTVNSYEDAAQLPLYRRKDKDYADTQRLNLALREAITKNKINSISFVAQAASELSNSDKIRSTNARAILFLEDPRLVPGQAIIRGLLKSPRSNTLENEDLLRVNGKFIEYKDVSTLVSNLKSRLSPEDFKISIEQYAKFVIEKGIAYDSKSDTYFDFDNLDLKQEIQRQLGQNPSVSLQKSTPRTPLQLISGRKS